MKKLIDCIKSGDKIWHIIYGWCTVYSIEFNMAYPIRVQLPYQIDTNDYKSFLADGREHQDTVQPSLFLNEITLKQELPEFIEGEIVIVYHGKWVIAKYHSFDTGNKHNVFLSRNPGCIFSEILTQVLTVKTFDKSHFQQ